MPKEPCTKKTIKGTLKEIFLASWAFVAYVGFFSWLSFGWIATQIWRFGGFSFTLSASDFIRLAVGFVGFFVCVFTLFITARKSCRDCKATSYTPSNKQKNEV